MTAIARGVICNLGAASVAVLLVVFHLGWLSSSGAGDGSAPKPTSAPARAGTDPATTKDRSSVCTLLNVSYKSGCRS
jgi:hypothetical protein